MKHYPFHIGDGILNEYLRLDEKLGIAEGINNVQYGVADAPLTYRQINELTKDDVLQDERDNERGWRKFSFTQLVFLEVVSELKGYRVRHEQLKELTQCFFKKPSRGTSEEHISKKVAEWSIGCALIGIEIVVAFYPDGKVAFYDPANYSLLHRGMMGVIPPSYIHINLNEVINKIRRKMGAAPIPVTHSISEGYIKGAVLNVSSKEEKLLEIMRNTDYKTLRIKKKDGGTLVINAERSDGKDLSEAEFAKILKEKDFQTVTATTRDGKVVNLKVEETIKL